MKKLLIAALVLAACAGNDDSDAGAPADTSDAVSQPAPAPQPASDALMDPDQASRDELLSLPGFDAGLADSLIARRPFSDMRAVDAVLASRLSEEQRDTVYTRLWKPIDLNTASDEEILLIPGVGERMEHEFKEYRPYQNIEQFRREIGKYVDAAEVARLEKYVRIAGQ